MPSNCGGFIRMLITLLLLYSTGLLSSISKMITKLALLELILLLSVYHNSASAYVERSLVIAKDTPPSSDKEKITANEIEPLPNTPQIYEMRLDANISNRYATIRITSKVKNLNTVSQEATFSIVTPEKAFISGFIMEIDGKQYQAYVKEKEEAKKTYDRAVASGIGAAHVAQSTRDSNRFTVSVHVEPQSKATFYLSYEELLGRTSDKYELVLNIQPGQFVKNLTVSINITESRPLKFVTVPSLRTGNEISKNQPEVDPNADIRRIGDNSAVISFSPNVVKQKLLASSLGEKAGNGLSGQFVVQYDVVRDPQGGEVLVDGDYFVHFFAPNDLTPLLKEVIFVLDFSGSMSGTPINQLKTAMNTILDEFKPEDKFSIISFSDEASLWNLNLETQQSVIASKDNILRAKQMLEESHPSGLTNIIAALELALNVVSTSNNTREYNPIIIFLTDGQPNRGESNPNTIVSKITKLNIDKVPIFSLSFGDGADRNFLQKLSLTNNGFARHIYQASDASLQLENFYTEISSPLLRNITFKYIGKVKNTTKIHHPILFRGSELRASGLTEPGSTSYYVYGYGRHGPVELPATVYQSAGSLERLWAYLQVRELLEKRKYTEDSTNATSDALKLALKYSFVTDITSLVVVKPNASSAVDTQDASKRPENRPFYPRPAGAAWSGFRPSFGSGGGWARTSSSNYAGHRILPMHQASITPYAGIQFSAPGAPLQLYGLRGMPGPPAPSFVSGHHGWTPSSSSSIINAYPAGLQWLRNIVNSNNTITVNGVNYRLGRNETFTTTLDCTNSVGDTKGFCSLVHKCAPILPQLTNFDNYKKYFCDLQGFAGVCCPLIV